VSGGPASVAVATRRRCLRLANVVVVDRPGWYLAILILALIGALWLALHIIGLVFQLVFFTLIVVVALAAFRTWQAGRPRAR
jgi:hypothetical protein